MIKRLKKIREVKGTALVVALLVMGVLIAISLALSNLIFGEIRATRELIDSGRAYYAAESGIESALYYLNTSLPGWQPDVQQSIGKVSDDAVFEYKVKNKCNAYPCFDDEEYNLETLPVYKFYDVLDLNENITIPLFTVENGKVNSVTDFTVEFFANFDPSTDLVFKNGGLISGWDVLRWKVFGMKRTAEGLVTEALHDFTAVSTLKNQNIGGPEDGILSNAMKPSWFGTVSCSGSNRGEIDGNRITGVVQCLNYEIQVSNSSSSGEQNIQLCDNTTARDYYLYSGDKIELKLPCYSIKEFMDANKAPVAEVNVGPTGLNYLSLTNLMNPAMLSDSVYGTDEKKKNASKLYFRVETYDQDTVREFADITVDGYSGISKQSINVKIKRDSYMPVFNFSIYSTYGSEHEYYQEVNNPKLP